jgi:DNA-binding NarL/FixJ family response regulator
MAIQPPVPAPNDSRAPDDASVVAVLAREPKLRRRMTAALSAARIRSVEVRSVDAACRATETRRCVALAMGCDLDGTPELLRTMRQRLLKRLAVVLVGPDESSARLLHRALRAGLDGFVLESQIDAALAPSVRAVLAGQVVVPRRERRQLLPDALSHREKEVLAMVVLGYSNYQISDRLFLAESTVKSHLSSTFSKLGVRSRSEAAALVLDPHEPIGIAVRAAQRELMQPLLEVEVALR